MMRKRITVVLAAGLAMATVIVWPAQLDQGSSKSSNAEMKALSELLPRAKKLDDIYSIDINDDGRSDLIALYDRSNLMVAIQKPDNTYDPVLNYHGMPMTISVDPKTAKNRRGARLNVDEYFVAAEWHGELIYASDTMRVAKEEDIPYIGVGVSTVRDFEKLEGTRKIETGASSKSTQSTQFKPIFSVRREDNIVIDGRLDVREWQKAPKSKITEKTYIGFHPERWNGINDLSFEVSSQWDDRNVYFAITVK